MSSCALLLAFAHRGFVSQQAVSELNANTNPTSEDSKFTISRYRPSLGETNTG